MKEVGFFVLLMSIIVFSASGVQANILVYYRIDTEVNRMPISPYIYGTNFGWVENATIRRSGGNRLTGYNWENNYSNAGNDWYHVNDNYLVWSLGVPWEEWLVPGRALTYFHDQSLAAGVTSLITLQMAGYVSADGLGEVSPSEVAPSDRWKQVVYAKEAPFCVPPGNPDTTDDYVYIDECVNFLVKTYGYANEPNGVKGYILDNEPDIWFSTHPRLHPAQATCAELIDKSVALSKAVKNVDPNAQIFGPASYGFYGYYAFQGASDWWGIQWQYGYNWFLDYYLDQMQQAQISAGRRLLDVLDLHWYPEARDSSNKRIAFESSPPYSRANAEARMQAPRTLWDPEYRERSWITDSLDGNTATLPTGLPLRGNQQSAASDPEVNSTPAPSAQFNASPVKNLGIARTGSTQSDQKLYQSSGNPAGMESLRPPVKPKVAPVIPNFYSNDLNHNKIDDALESRSQTALSQMKIATTSKEKTDAQALLENTVEVEMIFKDRITQKQIDDFLARGGNVSYIYKSVSYGWNGRIALKELDTLPGLMGASLSLVQEAKPVFLHLIEATRNGRVRPVWAPGFAGNASGFDGSDTITIAIVDTGIDNSHSDMTGREAYCKDFSGGSSGCSSDIIGHGSHVAGIATGTGAASGSNISTLYYTDFGDLTGVPANAFYPFPLGFPAETGTTFSSIAKWSGGGATSLYQVYKSKGILGGWNAITSAASGSSPLTENNTFSSLISRVYSTALLSNGQMQQFVITNSVTNYPGVGDGFNKLRGVAPGCRWANAKVARDDGTIYSTSVSAAIDDLVSTRVTNNIKVINLSLGGNIDEVFRQKVNNAVNNGIVVVVSAGNAGPDGQITDPGRAAMAITVAACNDEDQLTDYSSIGFSSPGSTPGKEEDYKPDITAPGGSASYYTAILSVDSGSADGAFADQQSNDYAGMQGTSMASPFVAGAAALIIDAMQQQGIQWDFYSNQYSRYVKMILCATASETNTTREGNSYNPTLQRASGGPSGYPAGKDPSEGYGILNPDAAVEAITQIYTVNSSAADTLGPGVYDRRVWARKVELKNAVTFAPALAVPDTGDFDLYLYSDTPGAYGTPTILASSTLPGLGMDESLSYVPTADTNCLIVVKRVSGSGTFALATQGNSTWVLKISSTSGGTTAPVPGEYEHQAGDVVSIQATANPGYRFVNWTGDTGTIANVNSASTTITMNGNYVIKANFSIDQMSLTTSATYGGTISTPGIGTYWYNRGATVAIAASPIAGYRFVNWTGTAVTAGKVANPQSADTTVSMDNNYTVQANFERKPLSDFLPLLPTLHNSINKYYPGTKLAISEYNYGAEDHISGGIATADVLGIFGKYGVYMAGFWQVWPTYPYVEAAFKMYRNYDGAHSTFGDTSVYSETSDKVNSSIYASVFDGNDSQLHLIVMNKNFDSTISGTFDISSHRNFVQGRVWRFNRFTSDINEVSPLRSCVSDNLFVFNIPPLTVCHIVLQAVNPPEDLDGDGMVTITDVDILCDQWLKQVDCSGQAGCADFDGNHYVDFFDFARLASEFSR